MQIELLFITPEATKLIEKAGRTSYMSHFRITEDSHKAFCKKLIDLGHESPLEHAYATFSISGISRACSHQLVRHRLASYTQKSQRHTEEKDFPTYTPPSIANEVSGWQTYSRAIDHCKEAYKSLVAMGIPWEDARMVLPNAQTTDIVMTANFREWRHVIKLRVSKDAQMEIRFLIYRILEILIEKYPSIFEDLIKPEEEVFDSE